MSDLIRNALKALVENEGLEAFSYLDKGIGTSTEAGKRWITARAVINLADEVGELTQLTEELAAMKKLREADLAAHIRKIDQLAALAAPVAQESKQGDASLHDYFECEARCKAGTDTALDRFIFNHEPAGVDDEREFRQDLSAALASVAPAASKPSAEAVPPFVLSAYDCDLIGNTERIHRSAIRAVEIATIKKIAALATPYTPTPCGTISSLE
jgi:hypothetical protein